MKLLSAKKYLRALLRISGVKWFTFKCFLFGRKIFATSKDARRFVFLSASPGSVLLAESAHERFIVHRNDEVISLSTYCNGKFDTEKLEMALAILGKDFERDLLVDIGANIGVICIPGVTRYKFRNVVAIEPDPRNYSLLVANIWLNGLQDCIEPRNLALSNTEGGELSFELSSDNFGDHRIRVAEKDGRFSEAGREVITVRAGKLDNLGINNIDPKSTLIWMDTQGFEGYILDGATSVLESAVPLVAEFWPYGMIRSGGYQLFKASIIASKYRWMYNLSKSLDEKLCVNEKNLDAIYEGLGVDGDYTDILFT